LTFVSLPKTLKQLPRSAFADCLTLKIMELPAGLEVVGDRAFDADAFEPGKRVDTRRQANYGAGRWVRHRRWRQWLLLQKAPATDAAAHKSARPSGRPDKGRLSTRLRSSAVRSCGH